MQKSVIVVAILLTAATLSGCVQSESGTANGTDKDGESSVAVAAALPSTMIERSSTVQLVKVKGSTDVDERPSDGNYYRRFDFEILASSGTPINSLIVPIAYGGMRPGPPPALPTELRFDSLRQGNEYWFLFGTDYDPQKNPFPVMAWWPAGQVPEQVVDLVKQDAYRWHPTYHKASGLTYGFEKLTSPRWEVIVKRDGELLWRQEVQDTSSEEGQGTLQVYEGANYEMAPIDAPRKERPIYLIYAVSKSKLADNNRFNIASGIYRLRTAWELDSGKRLAEWVLPERFPNDPIAMRQYRFSDGKLVLSARFESLPSGGLEAGAATDAWFRKMLYRHGEDSEVVETEVYRHGSVKDEQGQHVHNGWVLVRQE